MIGGPVLCTPTHSCKPARTAQKPFPVGVASTLSLHSAPPPPFLRGTISHFRKPESDQDGDPRLRYLGSPDPQNPLTLFFLSNSALAPAAAACCM